MSWRAPAVSLGVVLRSLQSTRMTHQWKCTDFVLAFNVPYCLCQTASQTNGQWHDTIWLSGKHMIDSAPSMQSFHWQNVWHRILQWWKSYSTTMLPLSLLILAMYQRGTYHHVLRCQVGMLYPNSGSWTYTSPECNSHLLKHSSGR